MYAGSKLQCIYLTVYNGGDITASFKNDNTSYSDVKVYKYTVNPFKKYVYFFNLRGNLVVLEHQEHFGNIQYGNKYHAIIFSTVNNEFIGSDETDKFYDVQNPEWWSSFSKFCRILKPIRQDDD